MSCVVLNRGHRARALVYNFRPDRGLHTHGTRALCPKFVKVLGDEGLHDIKFTWNGKCTASES